LDAERAPQLKAIVRHLSPMHYPSPKLLVLMMVFFASTGAYGQQDKMVSFLQTNWEVKTETNEWQFTGKFLPIPQQLQNDLLANFPKHRFSSAEMDFVGHILGTKPYVCRNGRLMVPIRQLTNLWFRTCSSFGKRVCPRAFGFNNATTCIQ